MHGEISISRPNQTLKKFITVSVQELDLRYAFTYRKQEYYFKYFKIYKYPSLVLIQSWFR